MKIRLNIPSQHIIEAHRLLSKVEFTGILSKEEKRDKSIFSVVFLKLAKKSLECQVNPKDKPIRMELEYHQAYELEQRLQELIGQTPKQSYERNAARMLINIINEKLV